MKELSIEEKAKAYDEALERAKELLEVGLKDTRDKRVVLSFFPELAESEDEKIRKGLIDYFSDFHLQTFAGLDPKKILAWLEKQGENHIVGNNEMVKPAWSERYIADVFEKVGLAKIVRKQGNENLSGALQSALIELGKNVPQPKQKWSEEDETRLTNIIIMLKEGASLHFNKSDITKAVDWLKSLKDRYAFKPSDEQMKALKEAVDEHFDIDGGALWHLYEDLKKL